MARESIQQRFGAIFLVHFIPGEQPDEDLALAYVWHGKSFVFMMESFFTILQMEAERRFILHSEQHCLRRAYNLPNPERLPDTHISHLTRVLQDRDHHRLNLLHSRQQRNRSPSLENSFRRS